VLPLRDAKDFEGQGRPHGIFSRRDAGAFPLHLAQTLLHDSPLRRFSLSIELI